MNVSRRGIEDNVLVRWVSRHTNVSTLFRSKQPVEMDVLSNSNGMSVAHTHTSKPPSVGKTVARWSAAQLTPERAPKVTKPSSEPTSMPESQEDAKLNDQTLKTVPVIARQGVEQAPKPITFENKKIDNREWQRLETIFHKHQEERESEAPDITPVSLPAKETLELGESIPISEPNEKKHIEETTAEKSRPPILSKPKNVIQNPKPIERADSDFSTSSVSPDIGSGLVQRKTQKDHVPNGEETLELGESAPISKPIEERNVEKSPAGKSRPLIPSKLESEIQNSKLVEREENVNPPEQKTEMKQTKQQKPPLQDIWPVQLQGNPYLSGEDHADQLSKVASTHKVDSDTPETTHETSGTISQHSPSPAAKLPFSDSPIWIGDSPVETLPPSQPRPLESRPSTSQTVVQMQVEDIPADGLAGSKTMVPTAIGLLPADLWQLIGESPPDQSPRTQLQRVVPFREGMNIVREPSRCSMTSNASDGKSNMVQRQTMPSAQTTLLDEPEKGNVTEESDKSSKTEINLDELSRQVYTEVRQRLKLERERVHGRM